jgi:hypothetical protein
MNQETAPKGRLASMAGYFIRSKLTVLIIIVSLVGGLVAVAITPREEDPTINVAMADVLLGYPGQGAQSTNGWGGPCPRGSAKSRPSNT